MVSIVLAVITVITMIMGMPIVFCLGFAALICLFIIQPVTYDVLAQKMFTGIDSFPLMAIPFFILSGQLMGKGGITKRLLKFSIIVIGRIRGGLGLANVLASMLFGGITGSAIADTSALGSIEIPMMVEAGYDKEFSAGITCASACMGPIIPPSIPMVLFSMAIGTSIGGLFVAGIIPGILIGLVLMVQVAIISIRRKYPYREYKVTFFEVLIGFRDAITALIMPIIILGGILGGIFTPTEAACVAVVYAFIITIFLYKEVKLSDLPKMFKDTAVTTAVVLILVSTSNIFAWIITMERVAANLADIFSVMTPVIFLLMVNILLLFAGTFLDSAPIILVLAPILTPIARSMGIHPLHFGIIFVINMTLGLLTPPLGQVLFVAVPIAKISFERVVVGVFPFLITLIIVLLCVTYIPIISMYLPRLFGFA